MNILKTIAAAINPPAPNPLQVYAAKFAESSGGTLISPADLKKLKAAHAEWLEAWRDRNERFTGDAARAEFQKQVTSGTPEDPDGLENLFSEYAARSQRAIAKMKEVDEASLPLVKQILQDFITVGERWIQARIQSEKNDAAAFGVAFSPSQILLTAQRIIASHKIKVQNLTGAANSPTAHLQFLKLD